MYLWGATASLLPVISLICPRLEATYHYICRRSFKALVCCSCSFCSLERDREPSQALPNPACQLSRAKILRSISQSQFQMCQACTWRINIIPLPAQRIFQDEPPTGMKGPKISIMIVSQRAIQHAAVTCDSRSRRLSVLLSFSDARFCGSIPS